MGRQANFNEGHREYVITLVKSDPRISNKCFSSMDICFLERGFIHLETPSDSTIIWTIFIIDERILKDPIFFWKYNCKQYYDGDIDCLHNKEER